VIVVAGREYLSAAVAAAQGGTYVRMEDWMRPAMVRGLWVATTAAGLILFVGFAAIRYATTAMRDPFKGRPLVKVKTVQDRGVA
jgi:hypothetical protein